MHDKCDTPGDRRWRRLVTAVMAVVVLAVAFVALSSDDEPDHGDGIRFTGSLELCVREDAESATAVPPGTPVVVPPLTVQRNRQGWDRVTVPSATTVGDHEVPLDALAPCDPADAVQCLEQHAWAFTRGSVARLVNPVEPLSVVAQWTATFEGTPVWVSHVDSIGWTDLSATVMPHAAPYQCGPDRRSAPPELTADVPPGVPEEVADVIEAANRIAGLPYRYGVGHVVEHYADGTLASGYDGSAAASLALHGGGYVSRPWSWQELVGFELAGPGRWITVYVCPPRTYLQVAGMYFDVWGEPSGPRWRDRDTSELRECTARHPHGF